MSILLTGVGNVTAAPLADGVYWYDGDAIAAGKIPFTGQGWTLTAALSDGVAGDTGTRVTGTGTTLSVLHVEAAPYDIANWNITAKWLGNFSQAFYEWDGSAWDSIADMNTPGLPHLGYTDEQLALTLNGAAALAIHLIVITSSDITGSAFMSCSDSRPST